MNPVSVLLTPIPAAVQVHHSLKGSIPKAQTPVTVTTRRSITSIDYPPRLRPPAGPSTAERVDGGAAEEEKDQPSGRTPRLNS